MKVAFAFLFVALNCYFGSGDTSYTAHKKVVLTIPKDCMEKFIKVDLPETLIRLQEMLCLYMKAKKTHNEELYKQFLRELHIAMIDGGCSIDHILSTPEFLKQVGDQVGQVAEHCGLQILKAVEDLGLSDVVMNFFCDALGETLKTLSHTLAGLNLNVGGVVGGGVGGIVGGGVGGIVGGGVGGIPIIG